MKTDREIKYGISVVSGNPKSTRKLIVSLEVFKMLVGTRHHETEILLRNWK